MKFSLIKVSIFLQNDYFVDKASADKLRMRAGKTGGLARWEGH
jgi:hypothetical protein